MTPTLRPSLVNGRWGDPALFVEIAHSRNVVLFDLGDLSGLSPRDLLRISHVFVSHMHMDHFVGFDALLRINVGRAKHVAVAGPEGIIAGIHHKLASYSWDLAGGYRDDLIFDVTELISQDEARHASFNLLSGFKPEIKGNIPVEGGLICHEPAFRVRAALLEHHGTSVGFAMSEPIHVNVWRNKVAEMGLAVGSWLKPLKDAVRDGLCDETAIHLPDGLRAPLGSLRHLVSVERGQKIGYVTDIRDTEANRKGVIDLCRSADLLFIEASFLSRDAALAWSRGHLTTKAAGEIARTAGVRNVEPFHFSPRYGGSEDQLMDEVEDAFGGA